MAKQKLSVFLAHAPGDLPAARALYGQLMAEGWLDVWFGEVRLSPGMDTQLEIDQAIGQADLAIICISKNATSQSGSFHRELRLILDAAQNMPDGVIFMIPLKLEACEPPHVLRHLHFASYFGEDRQRVYESVLSSLRTRASNLRINTGVKPAPVPAKSVSTTQPGPSSRVEIRDRAQGNIIVDGKGHHVTQHITNIYLGSERTDDPSAASQSQMDANE